MTGSGHSRRFWHLRAMTARDKIPVYGTTEGAIGKIDPRPASEI
jgi:hypothetical protein